MLGRALSLEKGAKFGNCMRQATLPTPSESWNFAIFSPQLLVSNIYIYIYIYILACTIFDSIFEQVMLQDSRGTETFVS